MSYYDIDPQDIDPETGRPYSNYSSPSLDTSFEDGERIEENGDWRGHAAARAKGYTRRVYIDGGMEGFEALIKPDIDLDGKFRAWDLDNGEWMTVTGSNCLIEDSE